jgi:hypothetical protein
MRVEDEPSVDFRAFVVATVGEGVYEDIAAGCGGESREPFQIVAVTKWARCGS